MHDRRGHRNLPRGTTLLPTPCTRRHGHGTVRFFCCSHMASCTTGGFERSLRIAVCGGWQTKTSSTSGARSAGPLLSVSASRPLLLLWSQLCGPWVSSLSHSALGSELQRRRPWNAGHSDQKDFWTLSSTLCRLWSVWQAVWKRSSLLPSKRTKPCRAPGTFSSGGVPM